MPGFMIGGKGTGPSNTEETHRIHRWSFEWHELGKTVQDFALNCNKPTPEIEVVTIYQQQNEVHVPGKHKWLPIKLTLYVMQKDTLKKLAKLRDKMVDPSKSMNNFMHNSDSVSEMTLKALDGGGKGIYTWTLKGCWVSKIEHPAFNYESSDLATVEVTVIYDYAEEK